MDGTKCLVKTKQEADEDACLVGETYTANTSGDYPLAGQSPLVVSGDGDSQDVRCVMGKIRSIVGKIRSIMGEIISIFGEDKTDVRLLRSVFGVCQRDCRQSVSNLN